MNVEQPRYENKLHEEFFRAAAAAGLKVGGGGGGVLQSVSLKQGLMDSG